MKVLLVVDVQNDFVEGGALEVPGAGAVIPVINRLQGGFDLVVATQDWHPPDHVSFASNHGGKKPFEQIRIEGLDQTLWPDHCVRGSEGSLFHPGLDTDRVEAILRKGTDREIDSYSCFYDNARRKSTGLSGYLREKAARRLYFTGLAADYCVYFSVVDALDEGFSATVIEDAVRALDSEGYARKRAELVERGVAFVYSHEL